MHTAQLKFSLFSAFLYRPFYTLMMVMLIVLCAGANTWRWHRLNSAQGIHLPLFHSAIATYLGIGLNSLLPGSVGGDVIRCYYVMKRFPARKSGAILSTLIDRVCGLMGIIVIASVIIVYGYPIFLGRPALSSIIGVCFSLLITTAAIVLASSCLPKQLGISQWLSKKCGHGHWSGPILSVLEAVRTYRKSKLVLLEALGASVVTQLLLLAVILLISRAMGLPDVPAYVYMMALAVGQIANLLPLTPGGIGIGELAFANVVFAFGHGSVMSAYATVFLAFRLLMTAVYLPGVIWGIFSFHVLGTASVHPEEA
jgi:uncharacterized protein (TIRG00374 family)